MKGFKLVKPPCKQCGGKKPEHRHDDYCSKLCEGNFKLQESISEEKIVQLFSGAKHWKDLSFGDPKDEVDMLIIGDTHFPFEEESVLEKIHRKIAEEKPKIIGQAGDLFDRFSNSRFPRSLSIMTPQAEYDLARAKAKRMWERVRNDSPDSYLFQELGNHDDRPYKQLMAKCPELEPFFNMNQCYDFDGVHTIHDSTQEVIIQGILFQHGYKKHGTHFTYNLMSTVVGHSHTGGIVFGKVFDPYKQKERIIWELNVGYVANPKHPALRYQQQKFSRWTHGYGRIKGTIENPVPIFYPLEG